MMDTARSSPSHMPSHATVCRACDQELTDEIQVSLATEFSLSKTKLVKVPQSCLTLWDPMDSTVHGILQARILEG